MSVGNKYECYCMRNFETEDQAVDPTFEDVFRENFDTITRFAERRGANHASEDVAQEAMLRMWRADNFDHTHARPWLVTVAGNLLVDRYRAMQVRPQQVAQDMVAETAYSSSDHTEKTHARIVAEQALGFMSPEQREVVELVVLQDCSIAEVAEKLSLPVGTVKTRKFYGLKAAMVALNKLGIYSAE